MAGIVIYGSQYGTAKEYAEELAKRTGFEARRYDDVGNLDGYDTIAYIGALYAGGVLGMKKTFAKLAGCANKTIAIATVGLADPTDEENVANIRGNIKRQLPAEVFEHARLFHLRGGIDYSRLGLKHKAMMRLLCNKAKNLPEKKKNAEVRAMIDTYGKQVSFVDFNSLEPLVLALS